VIVDIIFIFIGLIGLFIGGNWLVQSSSKIALKFGISRLIIGLTVVSIGTSAPELGVSIIASLRGSSDLAIGNIVGSNIANVGLVLGVAGLIAPISVKMILVQREIPFMIIISGFLYLMILDGEISRLDGLLLFLGFIGFTILFYFLAKQQTSDEASLINLDELVVNDVNIIREISYLVIGLVFLIIGSELRVRGASEIALKLGFSELAISVTMVAFGTSLPELFTAVIATMKKKNDILVGNIIGSNIINILLVLGLTAIIKPIPISSSLVEFEFLIMVGFSLLLLPFALDKQISRKESTLFLTAYVGFIVFSFVS
jgi:cation:H+ antiporter